MKKIGFAVVAAMAFANVAFADKEDTVSRPIASTIDFDRFHTDACYMSNCDNVPTAATAQAAAVRGGPSGQFTVLAPSYPSGQSCTSLFTVADNALQTILTGTVETNARGELDIDFNGEPRIYRLNGSTVGGVGTVGIRLIIEGGAFPVGGQELFFRWVLHENVDNTTINSVANPTGVNQPIISTAAVRRLVTGLMPNTSYTLSVQAKWSTQFTNLQLATQPFAISGPTAPRGAMMCVPQLIVENLAP
jgi:hypothetical protein